MRIKHAEIIAASRCAGLLDFAFVVADVSLSSSRTAGRSTRAPGLLRIRWKTDLLVVATIHR